MALSTEARETRTRRADAPAFYQAYLNSSDWRNARNRKLKEQRYTCERCGSRRDLNVHHKTYERLGRELMTDLEVVCFTCHNEHHERKADGLLGVYLKIVSTIIERDHWIRIPDLAEEAKVLLAKQKIKHEPATLQKAINMACATRLKDGRLEYRSVVDVDWERIHEAPPISHAQAVEFLKRLGVPAKNAIVKPMPYVELMTPRERARRKALEMVAQEIQASLERCAALEREVGE